MNRDQIISLFVAVYLAVYASVGVDTLRWLMGGPVSLLPALLVYSAIQHPSFWGVTIVGVVGGLLQDSFSSTPLGISVAALFAVGFTLNRKREYVMHQLPFARMLLGGIVGFVVPLLGFILTTDGVPGRLSAPRRLATVRFRCFHGHRDSAHFPIVPAATPHFFIPHDL